MTRSASCPAASGSSRTHWPRHIPCIVAKGIPFCRTSCCKSNVPWSENPGTRCLLHRRPKPRKPSTLWDLCKGEKKNRLSFYTHSHSHSQRDLRYRSYELLWSDRKFIRRFISQSQIAPCRLSFCSTKVSLTGQTPCSSGGCADFDVLFLE